MKSRTIVEKAASTTITELDLEPRGRVFPGPALWKDHVFYQILPDRFSDGLEAERPLFDRANPERYRTPDKAAWMRAGLRSTAAHSAASRASWITLGVGDHRPSA